MSRVLSFVNKVLGFDSAHIGNTSPELSKQKTTVGAVIVIALVGLGLVIVTVAITSTQSAEQSVDLTLSSTPSSSSGFEATRQPLLVHVTGDVQQPGIYEIPVGARVVDAVMAAGGTVAGVDPCGINLAREIKDGEQVHINTTEKACAQDTNLQSSSLVSLNSSAVEHLDTLPGIGPTLADRIISWRQSNGSFTSVEQLNEVPGIGDKLFSQIRDLVTL